MNESYNMTNFSPLKSHCPIKKAGKNSQKTVLNCQLTEFQELPVLSKYYPRDRKSTPKCQILLLNHYPLQQTQVSINEYNKVR